MPQLTTTQLDPPPPHSPPSSHTHTDDFRNYEYFGKVSLNHFLLLTILLGLIILCTIIGNAFVIAAIVLERNLRNVANYLIVSLAVADLMVAIMVITHLHCNIHPHPH